MKKTLIFSLLTMTFVTIVSCNSGTKTSYIYEQPAPMCDFGGSVYTNSSNNTSLKVANGCNPTESSDITKLVVALSSTNNPESAQRENYCTATPIADGSWVLTAAHCLTMGDRPDNGWESNDITDPRDIYLWQGSNLKTPVGSAVSVSKVYIASAYTPEAMGATSTAPADIALLKVNHHYQSRAILNTNNNLVPYSLLWLTGYGTTEYKGMYGILFYRQIYYATDISPFVPGNINVGELYTVGSIPVNNYVWKFVGPGDSGGGDFIYNSTNNKFYIVGVHSWSLLNPGTYGPLPAAYGIDTSVSYYESWINDIVNGSANPDTYVLRE